MMKEKEIRKRKRSKKGNTNNGRNVNVFISNRVT